MTGSAGDDPTGADPGPVRPSNAGPEETRGHAHAHAHVSGKGLLNRFRAAFSPHSHDIADQLDDALASSSLGIRTTKVTLAVLVATAAAQLVVALVSGSVALLADMAHNVADAMTSIPLWVAFIVGRRARSRTFTYGYRRAEDLAGVFILLVIGASAAFIAWESVHRLLDPAPMRHSGWVLLAGIIGVIGNEIAAILRIRVGRRIGSAALVADGYHARTDTIASFAVIVAVIGTWLGVPLLDPVVGLLITVMIVWILSTTGKQVVRRLMDGVEPQLISAIEASAAEVVGVESVGTVRARWTGHRLLTELTVTVAGDRSLSAAHDISEEVRHRLLHDIAHLDDAWIHVNPTADPADDPHHITAHHRRGTQR